MAAGAEVLAAAKGHVGGVAGVAGGPGEEAAGLEGGGVGAPDGRGGVCGGGHDDGGAGADEVRVPVAVREECVRRHVPGRLGLVAQPGHFAVGGEEQRGRGVEVLDGELRFLLVARVGGGGEVYER